MYYSSVHMILLSYGDLWEWL